MTELGLKHYGGTLGLYMQPYDEQVRALAYYAHLDAQRTRARERRDAELAKRKRRPRRGRR